MTYLEKLRDPRWQRLSAIVKERAEWKCERCGATDKNLQAHHKLYRKGIEPWEYEPWEFECLCFDCHEKVTKLMNKLKWIICDLKTSEMKRLFSMLLKDDKWERVELNKTRLAEIQKEILE